MTSVASVDVPGLEMKKGHVGRKPSLLPGVQAVVAAVSPRNLDPAGLYREGLG